MRAFSIKPQRHIAIVAKNPKALRIIALIEPPKKWLIDLFSVLAPSSVYMVYCQKFNMRFSAARAVVSALAIMIYSLEPVFFRRLAVSLCHSLQILRPANWVGINLCPRNNVLSFGFFRVFKLPKSLSYSCSVSALFAAFLPALAVIWVFWELFNRLDYLAPTALSFVSFHA